ncbi:hypothetical protein GCM10011583_12180 [Streptomyces camponoticapitis]|uniref:Uncharacterized protein n=1 Tax=Streptomyces camponoticapitis TaxID=1616125 RepID=A0ABQ2DZU8_9ACTN|nr:hypothetical protein [Streptomyces camponoticapitis]GGJ82184.1 hypothetical protein GCM10011583_12180 [Streptomyces camponoticapitis]
MSSESWRCHPGGSGAGRMQRVSVADRVETARRVDDGRVSDAYKKYLHHLDQAACGTCPELLEGRCDEGQALWDTYKKAMRP